MSTFINVIYTHGPKLLAAISTIIVILITVFVWRRRWLYYHGFKIPGPFGIPLLGSIYLLTDGPHGIHNFLNRLYDKYPSVWKMWMGPDMYISTTDPEHLKTVMTRFLSKGSMYHLMSDYFGGALAASKVEAWKVNRKNVNPTFNIGLINTFTEPFIKHGKELADSLGRSCGVESEDVFPAVWRHTLDAACETLSDVDPALVKSESFVAGTIRLEEIILQRFFNPVLHLNIFWNISPWKTELLKLWRQNCSYIQKIIDLMKRNNDSGKRRFLQQLVDLEAKAEVSHSYVLEEAQIMYFVGTETSAAVLSTTLVVLGMYPEVQDKIDEELASIFGNSDRDPTLEDANHMEYLERVLRETMRLLPPIPFILRTLNEDLQVDSYVFPAGANVIIPLPIVHRRPEFWPDPLKFDPDRFLPEEVEKRPPCSYIPFSYGIRNCIGSKYAMLSMKMMLSTILRRYRIKSSNYKSIEEIDILLTVVAKAKKGYKIVVEEKREKGAA